MQRGCVHVVLVVLWALGTVLECYCGSSWVVRSGGCCVDFRGIDAKKKQLSGVVEECQEYVIAFAVIERCRLSPSRKMCV